MSHRVTEEWMGQQVETLEDLLRPGLRAVCIGINPAPTSVRAGHYGPPPIAARRREQRECSNGVKLPTQTTERGHKTDTSETTRATPRDAPAAPSTLLFAGKTVSRIW
jgi:hypothetical protein